MVEGIVAVALRAILASIVLGAVLAALVFVATRFLALTAATRHALWTTALVATALMPFAGIGMSVWKAVESRSAQAPTPAISTVTAMVTQHVAHGVPRSHQPAPTIRSHAVGPVSDTSPPRSVGDVLGEKLSFVRWTPRMSRTLALGVVGLWALGALAGLIGLAASLIRVRGLKRRSSPLDGTLADELPWLTEIAHGREIYLRLSFETETPVAIGFSRPVILIPTELATAEGLAAIEQLVLHEYAHLRRYDDWTNLVQRVIERVFWFNPIVWLVGRRIALEREIASDDAVVEKTGEAHAYATSLWRLAREMRMPEHAVVAPGALLTRKQITVRIEQLLDERRARLRRSPATALGVLLAGIAAVGFVATSAPAVELPAVAENSAAPLYAAHDVTLKAHHPAAHAMTRVAQSTEIVVRTQSSQHGESNVAPLEQKTVRFELVPMATLAPSKHANAPAAVAPRTRILVEAPPGAPAPPHPDGAAMADVPPPAAPLPPIPPHIAIKIQTGTMISQEQLARVQSAASAAVARAIRTHSSAAQITPEVTKSLQSLIATLPREIAEESSWSRQTRFDGVKLSRQLVASCIGCSFRNADVRGVDLHGLKLNAIDFTGADMRGADLSGAQLIGVTLARANLSNADLRNAEINGSELRGATLDGAQLEGIKLIAISIRHVSLRLTSLRSVLANCTGCDLATLDVHGQDLHGITLTGADLSHADLRGANLSGAHFIGVDLSYANLVGADLTNARFDQCNAAGVDLRGAKTNSFTMSESSTDG